MDIYTAYPRKPTALPQLERGIIIQYQIDEYDAFRHVINYLRKVQQRHVVMDNAMPEIAWEKKFYTCTQSMQYLDRNSALRHPFKVCFLDLHTPIFQTYVTLLELEYKQRKETYAEENDEPPGYFLTQGFVNYFRQVCQAHFPDLAHMQ